MFILVLCFFLLIFGGADLFKSFPIRGIFAGSEAFPISQMNWFKQNFNIQIAHWYGHSEYVQSLDFVIIAMSFISSNYGLSGIISRESNKFDFS